MIGAYDEMQQEKEKCKGLEEKYQENTREKNKEEKTYEKISSELAANENKKAKLKQREKFLIAEIKSLAEEIRKLNEETHENTKEIESLNSLITGQKQSLKQ